MSLRLLVTGANGQLGWHLRRTLSPLGEVMAVSREELDLSDLDAVAVMVRDLTPDILVNAAAYTAVDKAESEPELARAINAAAPARMASELARNRCLLVHYSTDYVFDGSRPANEAYGEDDPTGPLSVYGKSKLEGEQLIAASRCPHIILRTSWVYDIRGKNFLRTVLRLAGEREELRMVGDQRGAPTWARTIAGASAILLARSLEHKRSAGDWPSGLFHLTSGGVTTWAGFAEAIVEDYEELRDSSPTATEFSSPLKAKKVIPIASEEYPTPARRPLNSQLSNRRIQEQFGIVMPDWRTQLRLAMQDAVRR